MKMAEALRQLEALAGNPDTPEPCRAAARTAIAALTAACELAVEWGGDEHAAVRVDIFERAVTGMDPGCKQQLKIALGLDALCAALEVPLEGSVAAAETC